MCELTIMERTPGTMELADKAGISKSYASEIVNGKRPPSRALAIHIFQTLGWKHSTIAGLTDDDLATLSRLDPWSPRPVEQAA